MERRMSRRKIALFMGDALFIGATLGGAVLIQAARHRRSPLAADPTGWGLLPHILLWACYLAAFYIFDLYHLRLKVAGIRFAGYLAAALAVVVVSGGLLYSLFPRNMNRALLVRHLVLTALFAVSWRALFFFSFKLTTARRTVLLVGPPESSVILRPLLDDMKGSLVVAGGAEDVLERTRSAPGVGLIIFSPQALDDAGQAHALAGSMLKGVPVVDLVSCLETMTGKLPLSLIGDRWLLHCEGLDPRGKILYKRLRRVIDLAAGALILLAGLPLAVLIGLAVKATSKGPVFYRQERTGKSGRPFRLIKFRTMKAGSDETAPCVPDARDPRITALGKLLRRTRLDELPQAVNIIAGDMSFIGPRPERPDWVRRFERDIPLYPLRFLIKPGLTGWAQVNNPCGNSLEETKDKLEYDLYYLKNMGLLLDLRILLKTVRIVLIGKGR